MRGPRVIPIVIAVRVVVGIHVVIDVVLRVSAPFPTAGEEPEHPCHLQQREQPRDPRRDGEGSVGPGEQESKRGHDFVSPLPRRAAVRRSYLNLDWNEP